MYAKGPAEEGIQIMFDEGADEAKSTPLLLF